MMDFTPIKEKITLHGLGFIQILLPENNKRMHVWHPELPKRKCFEFSSIHNHRFSFNSTVLFGTQVNHNYNVYPCVDGDHDMISHNGPRTETGARLSFVDGRCDIEFVNKELIHVGETYKINMHDYHSTPNDGIVITELTKLEESEIHAHSIIKHGMTFDQSFDRFQLTENQLWDYVLDAFKHSSGLLVDYIYENDLL